MRTEYNDCLIIAMMLSETFDCCMDWRFYFKLYQENPSGVPETTIQSIYIFAVWGTFLYICTFLSFLFDLCSNKNRENICTTILSCLSSTTEDFPQIIFAIVVATKTSQIITPVQHFKALYGIIEPFIRSRNIYIERMLNKTHYQNRETEFMKFWDMIFSFFTCLCCVGLLLRIIIIQYILF